MFQYFRNVLAGVVTFLLLITQSISFSFSELFGPIPKPVETSSLNKTIYDLFSSFDSYTNIRGGNSKFHYIPENNYREIFIYPMTDVIDSVVKDGNDIGKIFMGRIRKRDTILKSVTELQDLDMAAMDKGIFTICKWAKSIPGYPLTKYEHCSVAELKSILG